MIFKAVGGEFIPCEIKDIRAGDFFCVQPENKNPQLFTATADAKLRGKKWSVKVT